MIGQINDLMNMNRLLSIETICAQLNISLGTVHIIFFGGAEDAEDLHEVYFKGPQ